MTSFQHLHSIILRAPLYPHGSRPDFREPGSAFRIGLRAAAPGFLRILDATAPGQALAPKAARSLLRYQLRAAGRSTPFGSFAGLTLIHATDGKEAEIRLAAPLQHRFRLRSDARRQDEIARAECARAGMDAMFRTNSSLYRSGQNLRYASTEGSGYGLNAVPAEPHLAQLMDAARTPLRKGELLQRIVGSFGVSEEEALAYLDELIGAELLLPASLPALTGGQDDFRDDDDTLSECRFDALQARLDAIIPNRDRSVPDLQIDTYLGTERAAFPKERLDVIAAEIAALSRLARPYRLPQLEAFKQRFAARYDRAAVPLLEALDPDTGIGYGPDAAWAGPLLEPLAANKPAPDTMPQPGPSPDTMPAPRITPAPDTMPGPIITPAPDTMPGPVVTPAPDTMPGPQVTPAPHRPNSPGTVHGRGVNANGFQSAAALVQRKFLDALRAGASEIVLSDADLASLLPAASAFGKTIAAMGSVQQGADGDWRFSLDFAGGVTALSLLGRFSQGDPDIAALAQELAGIEAEAEPECELAEVVHLPSCGLGNVSRRALMRGYEIPYLGVSGAPSGQQLDPQDLLLQLHGEELCLYSRRLGCRILPRLSTAHNFSRESLPVYRFLCELQYQGQSQPAVWDWGAFRSEPELPAVRYGHIVLCERSWRLPAGELNGLDPEAFRLFCASRGLPDLVRCGHGDQRLLYNLRNADEAGLLLSELIRDPNLRLEAAGMETGSLVRDAAGGAHAHELIIPLLNAGYRPSIHWPLLVPDATVRRDFAPGGGGWHYLRIFCGIAVADEIIREALPGCCREMEQQGLITQWFFLRYHESEPELRLRFRLREGVPSATLEPVLHEWLLPFIQEGGGVSRIVVDTYRRELERYGADAIEVAEALFSADSRCTAGFLSGGAALPDEAERFAFACCGIDALLTDAGVATAQRIAVLEPLAAAFFAEHGGGLDLQQGLNAGYRKQRSELERYLAAGGNSEEVAALLSARSVVHHGLFAGDAMQRAEDGLFNRRLQDLMHMQLNRIFRAEQRRYEMLIYHCMLRFYRSVIARKTAPVVEMRAD